MVAAGLVSLLFGLLLAASLGVRNGSSNHQQYLLDGLRRADPAFLPGDWFTGQIEHHHPWFGWLVEGLARSEWLTLGLAAASVLSALVLAAAVRTGVGVLFERPALPSAVTLMLLAATMTGSIGLTDILRVTFEPAVPAAVLVAVGLAAMAHGRWLLAGAAWGAAALAHAHYALLLSAVLILCAATGAVRRRSWGSRWLWLGFLPLAAPSLVAIVRFAVQPDDPVATEVLAHVRLPHHLAPATWPFGDYAKFLSAGLLGVGGWLLRRPRPCPDLALPFYAMAAIVLVSLGIGLTGAWPALNQVFPWRLAPFLAVGGLALAGAALAEPPVIADQSGAARVTIGWAILAAGLALLVRYTQHGSGVWLAGIAAALTPVIVVGLPRPRVTHRGGTQPPAWHLALVIAGTLPAAWHGVQTSHVAIRPDDPTRQAVYQWIRRETPPRSVIAAPPSWSDLRLNARRAVVADWKATPVDVAGIREWYDRIAALAGHTGPRSVEDADLGYQRTACERAGELRARYAINFLILPLRSLGAACGTPVYQDSLYAIIASP